MSVLQDAGSENSVKASVYLIYRKCFRLSWQTQCSSWTSVKTLLLYEALWHVFPISYVITCKNDRRLIHSERQCRLINYVWSVNLSLLQACFWGVLYAMLLGKMEIISRVEPFGRIITFLEFIGLHGFSCCLHVAMLCYVMLIHRIWHLCNLPCAYTLFLLVSIVRYEF